MRYQGRAETKEFYLYNRFHLLSQSELWIRDSSHTWHIGSSFCARAGRDRCVRTSKRPVSFGLINAANGWGTSTHKQVPHARPDPPGQHKGLFASEQALSSPAANLVCCFEVAAFLTENLAALRS